LWLVIVAARKNPFKESLTRLPKPGGGEFGEFYRILSLNDPRISNFIRSWCNGSKCANDMTELSAGA
jgi:hypothetical protein